MKKIEVELYKDYQEHPYISPDRDLQSWLENPSNFPYAKVDKKQMIRLEEGILPGDLILLWRVGFNTFTTESIFPAYFEYRYGVNPLESLKLITKLGYMYQENASNSLHQINAPTLKLILKKHNLKTSGSKKDLMTRALENLSEDQLSKEFELRQYTITNSGKDLLIKYDDIIQKHGIKKM